MDNTVILIISIIGFIVVWLALLLVAAIVAPEDRMGTFVWLTLALGPLAILAAAVASPRDPSYFAREPRSIAKGRTRCCCSRCGAESDLIEPKGFSCWRCSESKYMVVDS